MGVVKLEMRDGGHWRTDRLMKGMGNGVEAQPF